MGHSRAIRSAQATTAATTRRIHQTNRRTIQEEAATRRAAASDCGKLRDPVNLLRVRLRHRRKVCLADCLNRKEPQKK